jgi:hypothetical protein
MEIDTVVWPVVDDLAGSLTDPNNPGQTVDVSIVRERYDRWRQDHEKLIGLHDELWFEHDQLQIQLIAATNEQTVSDRESALEAENISLKAHLAAQLARQSMDHLVDHKPTIFTGTKDFEAVATFLGQVEHFVEQGGGAFPERLTDPDGRSYELSLDDKLVDTFWRYVNREVLDWFKRATNIARLPPHNHAYRISWEQLCTLFKDYYVPKIAKSVVRTQWRELKFMRNDMAGFNKRAYELMKLLGGSLELDRESDSGLFEDYWLKLPDVARNEIAQLERMWGAVNRKVTLGDAMNLANERYLRVGSSGSTYLSTASFDAPAGAICAAPTNAPPAQTTSMAQPCCGPEPMDVEHEGAGISQREKTEF